VRKYHLSKYVMSDSLSTHLESDYNNANTPFDFTEENYKEIDRILAKYPSGYKLSACMPLLDLAQRQNDNW